MLPFNKSFGFHSKIIFSAGNNNQIPNKVLFLKPYHGQTIFTTEISIVGPLILLLIYLD